MDGRLEPVGRTPRTREQAEREADGFARRHPEAFTGAITRERLVEMLMAGEPIPLMPGEAGYASSEKQAPT